MVGSFDIEAPNSGHIFEDGARLDQLPPVEMRYDPPLIVIRCLKCFNGKLLSNVDQTSGKYVCHGCGTWYELRDGTGQRVDPSRVRVQKEGVETGAAPDCPHCHSSNTMWSYYQNRCKHYCRNCKKGFN